ncbi:MAG: SLBB domain-containing protein [bacterium]
MRRIVPVLLVLLALSIQGQVQSGEYVVGAGDLLQLSFWQDPLLNSSVKVRQDGYITVDIVGEMMAAGKTTVQLQDDIVRQMSRLNKRISQVTVRVTEYHFQYVFVTGQVNAPGKLTFEQIPDLVTVLNEAGWITDHGDLSRVTIIRGGELAGQVQVVDVASAIAAGNASGLPGVFRQDAIEVPLTPAGIRSADIGVQATRKNVIYVTGAVNTPGAIRFETNIDVYEAIALAGGPTDAAKLEEVKVISKDGAYAQAYQIDLKKYSTTGTPARYILSKEDQVVVPVRRNGFWGGTVGTAATVIGVVTSAVLLYQNLKPQDQQAN